MKIIVTGGAGFIGSHVVDEYVNKGHTVGVIDNFSTGKNKNLNPKAQLFKADIRQKEHIDKIIDQFKPDILNHHAAQLDVRKSVADPSYDAEVNILGLINLLEAGRKNNLKKVVFASSGGVVYGDTKQIPTSEEYQPLHPLSPYGVSKLTSEHYLYYYYKVYGISHIALRYANVYGPRQDPHGEAGVVAIFAKKLLRGEVPIINGDGKQTRDYIYIADIVQANMAATNSDYVGCLNVGTGIETSVNDLYRLLVQSTKTKSIEKHGPFKIGEQKRSALDTKLIKNTLNWNSTYTLNEGLKKTVEFFKDNE